MKSHNLIYWGLIALVGTALLLAFGSSSLQRLKEKLDEPLPAVYGVLNTTATVRRKEHVRFDNEHRTYTNDLGDIIEMKPGDEHLRIYYQIDNFDQLPEKYRSSIAQAEEGRIKNLGFRFWNTDQARYEKTEVGDKLEVSYHPIGDDLIEIVTIRNLTHPVTQ